MKYFTILGLIFNLAGSLLMVRSVSSHENLAYCGSKRIRGDVAQKNKERERLKKYGYWFLVLGFLLQLIEVVV